MSRFASLTRSQLRRRAILFTCVWLSWLSIGELIARHVPHPIRIPILLLAMIPFIVAGRYGMELWFRAKTTPELPRAEIAHRDRDD